MSKHDGFRIMARRDAASVRFLTKWARLCRALPTGRRGGRCYCLRAHASSTVRRLSPTALAVFDLIRGHRFSQAAVLCAFDLLELDGEDFRREPIKTRKSTLKSLLRGKRAGIAFKAHFSRGWRNRLPSGLRARLRGHGVEAPGLTLSLRPRGLLGEGQKPGSASSHARGRGGVELTPLMVFPSQSGTELG
jgi:hypothetical protein